MHTLGGEGVGGAAIPDLPAAPAGTLFTIGYGNGTRAGLMERIPAGVIVVDVRERPASARAELSAAGLGEALGTRYWSLPALGNAGGRRDRWVVANGLLAGFLLHGLGELLARGRSICLLCAERDVRGCHRRFVAAELLKRAPGAAREDL
jgi:uncharacterized protein (DUF488 family)